VPKSGKIGGSWDVSLMILPLPTRQRTKLKSFSTRRPDQSSNTFMKVMDLAVWTMILVLFIVIRITPLSKQAEVSLYLLAAACAVFNLLYFRVLLPRFANSFWLNFTAIVLMVGVTTFLNAYFDIATETVVLFAILTTGMGIRYGIFPSFLIAVASIGGSTWIAMQKTAFTPTLILFQVVELVLYLGGGFIGSAMAQSVRSKARENEHRNRNLSMVIEASTILSTLDLEHALPQLAEKIVYGLSFACCRICLYDSNANCMVQFAAFPVRFFEKFENPGACSHLLGELPWHSEVMNTRRRLIVRLDSFNGQPENEEQRIFFFKDLQSACLVPLIAENQVIGVISVGEARKWDREPITTQKIDLLETIASNAGVMVYNARLHQMTRRQFERMQVLNQIARDLSDTLELDDLMERIFRQLNRVIPAETYFIGLYHRETEILDLRVVIDEGVRFPPRCGQPARQPHGLGRPRRETPSDSQPQPGVRLSAG
jgi:GAF domain-containing protein